MRELHIMRAIAVPIVAVFFVTALPESEVLGQTGRAPTSVQRRVDELNRQGEQYEREQLNADLKGRPHKPGDRKRAQALASEVKQDFNNLQAGYNQIVMAMAAKSGFVYESVSDAINEIAKSSTRLKQNLALPQPNEVEEKTVQREAESELIEELLLTLRKHIYSFVTNPLFESQGVLDVEQGNAASRNLDRIIALSKTLKRNGDRLKEAGKPK